jgi:hypothetical protein
VRVALAILIAVVQVAGSWLCCCGPDRWLAGRSTQGPPSHCGEPAVATADPVTCPHCKQAGVESKPAPTKAPRKHSPLPDQCPCGGMKIESVPPAVTAPEPAASAHALFAPFTADVCTPDTVAASGLVPGGVSGLPFLPAESRLFVHHVLRC